MLNIKITTTLLLLGSVAHAETHYVAANPMSFSPDVIYVNAGDTVHWDYISGFNHTVSTGTNCLWDGLFHESLASFNPVVEWVIPMDAPSEIPYMCLPHCNTGMTAMIYVTHPEPTCPADITEDEIVNVSDLLMVIVTLPEGSYVDLSPLTWRKDTHDANKVNDSGHWCSNWFFNAWL